MNLRRCTPTARGASQRGSLRTIKVSDAAHNASLVTFYQYFGDVNDTARLIALLAAAGGSAVG